ncbi:MAG: tRNA preQ1(34) S-adenosylmethionine ribosyltransferase-isomerase QueA [Candidatus Magasanikbacteria bacterium CG_4_10_14_0_8_um_filter_32_14]|uniref:S-adenosylmethionine:tRNA ribosyltransferase-isomerase n=2 Tax=Candidatus Magasanikiibacteriota TaxID=1752731 RepID=A0A2M7RAE0_9BACT|nr:MAG: tRNA preQ1(34) S-adenosylmethionine ribosyltransferase-isomerase QueA [Candidatus Magasanikbacteria bacterium CG1_02_32_51]PIY93725.1 MAG: tRNA preQ1(34) S-adenosylmethionine ribosyltransferase-isomerase QueA [Candidatus Magasanikbacteria bacterium CG_4_10_14_0_8_um_filter_32_14]
MNTSDFDYNLPNECIAQKPLEPRDSSKLFLVNKKNKKVDHKHFYDIVDYFKSGDLLVWNNSKVFKARLFGRLEASNNDVDEDGVPDKFLLNQKEVEIFLVRPMNNSGVWKILAKPGKRVKPGMNVRFAPNFFCTVVIKELDGTILVQFEEDDKEVMKKANQYGHIPVPPYVKDEPDQLEFYQTIYSKEEGSVAAPTAGFHFTTELIEKLKFKGVDFAEVTLHVGLGTFLPVKSERIEDHTMHSEWVEISEDTADKINKAKKEGRRVIAVGTTTVRTLEGVAKLTTDYIQQTTENTVDCRLSTVVRSYTGDINIFIKPGFEFKIVDAMITNFHLPKSTLLILVSAFVGDRLAGRSSSEGREFMLQCYKEAIEKEYRFYSFGDAMFIY